MRKLENNLARLLKHAWANSESDETRPPLSKSHRKLVMGRGGISFYPDGRKAFYDIVSLLRGHLGETMSVEMISRVVTKYVARLHMTDKRNIERNAAFASHDLLEELRNYPHGQVSINTPVYGISLWPTWLTVEIGCVAFYSLFSGVEEERWRALFSIEDWKFIDWGLSSGNKFGGSRTWAKATFDSYLKDDEYHRWEAIRLFREAIGLVSLFIYAIREDERPLIMPGLMMADVYHVSPDSFERFVKEDLRSGKHSGFPFVGSHTIAYSLNLTKDVMSAFNTSGFKTCADCLRTEGLTELQRRVRRTLDYVAMGLREADRPQRFVWLMTALEALLLHEHDQGGKARKLACRVQMLLGAHPDIEILYDMRSRIVHGDLVQNVPIRRLEYILYKLIVRLLTAPEKFISLDQALFIATSGSVPLKRRVLSRMRIFFNSVRHTSPTREAG
jgi:hypothetical protein